MCAGLVCHRPVLCSKGACAGVFIYLYNTRDLLGHIVFVHAPRIVVWCQHVFHGATYRCMVPTRVSWCHVFYRPKTPFAGAVGAVGAVVGVAIHADTLVGSVWAWGVELQGGERDEVVLQQQEGDPHPYSPQ